MKRRRLPETIFRIAALGALISISSLLAWCVSGRAAEISGQRFDDAFVLGDGASLPLRSLALKEATFFKVDVYAIGLYRHGEGLAAQQILDSGDTTVLLVRFLIDVKGSKLAESWLRDLRAGCVADCDSVLAGARRVAAKLPDVKKGQTVTYVVTATSVEILIDGASVGSLEGASATRSVLAAVFGTRAPKRLRDDLLRPLKR